MIPTIRNGLKLHPTPIVVSHNIANAARTVVKKSCKFLIPMVLAGPLPGIDLGQGARTDGPRRQHSQGALKPIA